MLEARKWLGREEDDEGGDDEGEDEGEEDGSEQRVGGLPFLDEDGHRGEECVCV